MIELASTKPMIDDEPSIKIEPETKTRKRVNQPLWIFWIVVFCELFTAYAILFLGLLEDSNTAYLIYIVGTFIRSSVWFYSSIQLVGFSKVLFRMYFLMDSILLFELSSIGTFISLNFNKEGFLPIWSMCMYPFLLFFLSGNFRVMAMFANWNTWQVFLYKVIKFKSVLFYLGYGIYSTL